MATKLYPLSGLLYRYCLAMDLMLILPNPRVRRSLTWGCWNEVDKQGAIE